MSQTMGPILKHVAPKFHLVTCLNNIQIKVKHNQLFRMCCHIVCRFFTIRAHTLCVRVFVRTAQQDAGHFKRVVAVTASHQCMELNVNS